MRNRGEFIRATRSAPSAFDFSCELELGGGLRVIAISKVSAVDSQLSERMVRL